MNELGFHSTSLHLPYILHLPQYVAITSFERIFMSSVSSNIGLESKVISINILSQIWNETGHLQNYISVTLISVTIKLQFFHFSYC